MDFRPMTLDIETLNTPHLTQLQTPACVLSVVVPCFNEEEVLPIFHARLVAALAGIEGGWEVVDRKSVV